MAQPVQPGSYTALFRQRLVQTVIQMAVSNPLAAAGNAGGISPLGAQLDAVLLGNMQSLDGMLATVGLSATSGLGAPGGPPDAAAGNAGGLIGAPVPLRGPQLPQLQQESLDVNENGFSLTG